MVCLNLSGLQVQSVISYQLPPRRLWLWWCGGLDCLDAFLVLTVCAITALWAQQLIKERYGYINGKQQGRNAYKFTIKSMLTNASNTASVSSPSLEGLHQLQDDESSCRDGSACQAKALCICGVRKQVPNVKCQLICTMNANNQSEHAWCM